MSGRNRSFRSEMNVGRVGVDLDRNKLDHSPRSHSAISIQAESASASSIPVLVTSVVSSTNEIDSDDRPILSTVRDSLHLQHTAHSIHLQRGAL